MNRLVEIVLRRPCQQKKYGVQFRLLEKYGGEIRGVMVSADDSLDAAEVVRDKLRDAGIMCQVVDEFEVRVLGYMGTAECLQRLDKFSDDVGHHFIHI